MLYKKYLFGDTAAYYVQTEEFGAGLMLFPADVEIGDADALSPDCMVQCVLRGAQNLVDYTNGITLRNRSSARLAILSQRADERSVVTRLSDGAGNDYIYFDCLGEELTDPVSAAVRLSDRHKGIGGDGIVKNGVEESIISVGRLGREGMRETDREILRIMTQD